MQTENSLTLMLRVVLAGVTFQASMVEYLKLTAHQVLAQRKSGRIVKNF